MVKYKDFCKGFLYHKENELVSLLYKKLIDWFLDDGNIIKH